MYSNADVAVALSKRSVKFVNLIQQQFTPVYALSRSRDSSESLSLGGAPFLRRSPEETNGCQCGKAVKTLPLGRAKSSLTNFRLWRGNLAAFCRLIRKKFTTLSRQKNDHSPRTAAFDSDSRRISRSFPSYDEWCVASGEKELFPARTLHSRATLYH